MPAPSAAPAAAPAAAPTAADAPVLKVKRALAANFLALVVAFERQGQATEVE